MVQYGSRRYEREGVAGSCRPAAEGSGLLTINNLLGLFLALLLVYQLLARPRLVVSARAARCS